MKFEKREITLNEIDSLKDSFYFEETLLARYQSGLDSTENKETTETIRSFIRATESEIQTLSKLMKKSSQNDL